MNEDQAVDFVTYLRDKDYIDQTDVWFKGYNPNLFGRTFTPSTLDWHRIEIYQSEVHTNEEVMMHELAHVRLYKLGIGLKVEDHGQEFREAEKEVTKIYQYFKTLRRIS